MAAELELKSVIGFGGSVPSGLVVHPDREHLIYPLGATLVVEAIAGKRAQSFLQGHTHDVSCVCVSPSGRYVASGQETYTGYPAEIIVWDFKERRMVHKLSLHKQKVEAVCFSPNESRLVSLGGADDDTVVLWDVASGKALCGNSTSNDRGGAATCVGFSADSDDVYFTAGNNSLRVWEFNDLIGKAVATDVQTRGLRRTYTCVASAGGDTFFAGTASGDIICASISTKHLKSVGPERTKFEKGVTSMTALANGTLLVGSGSGAVSLVKPAAANWKVPKTATVAGSVTSVSPRGDGHEFYVGTAAGNIYRFGHAEFDFEERTVCHSTRVNDVAFPEGTSEIFATCAGSDIRLWHARSHGKELLRITVPNKTCNCIAFSPSGNLILSGWDDSSVRCFLPESGKLHSEIHDAAGRGVTSLAMTHSGERFVTGGGDGQVRVWRLTSTSAALEATLKEHTGGVTSVMINSSDDECVTSSSDGTCIVWNLQKFVRSQIIFANTLFSQARYRPDEAQILTVGSDRKVAYWECYDGSLIRDVQSSTDAINSVDISADGEKFVIGGADKVVKVFTYRDCDLVATGTGHAAAISRVKVSPNMDHIVTVSADGAIYRWGYA